MDNLEKPATLGTQDEDNQNKKHNTISVGHHYTQTNTNNLSKTCKQLEVKTNRTSFYVAIATDITTRNSDFLAIVLSVLL